MTEHKLITHIALVLVGNLVESLSDVQLGLDDMEEGEDLLVAVRIEREQNIFLCILVERGSAAAATARAVKLSFTVRSHTVMVWRHYLPKKSLLVGEWW